MMVAIAPIGRTPMDKEGSRSLGRYQKEVLQSIGELTPWTRKRSRRDELLLQGIKPGEAVVVLDVGDDPKNPVFAGLQKRKK